MLLRTLAAAYISDWRYYMFLFNPINYILQIDMFKYLFVAFGLFGVFLCLKKIILRG